MRKKIWETAYRTKVEQCANDNAFYETLRDFIREFSFTGHLDLWGRRYESELASLRAYVKETGEAEKEPYLEALDNPVSHNTYAAMTAFYQEEVRLTEERRAEENGGWRGESAGTAADGEAAAAVEEVIPANVETEILEPGKTAYVFIDTFDYEWIETDRQILLPFYEKVMDYDNLIIDITNNLGGSMRPCFQRPPALPRWLAGRREATESGQIRYT